MADHGELRLAPRRVWIGLRIPGQRMMGLLMPEPGSNPSRALRDLCSGEAHLAVNAAAEALKAVPKQGGRLGPRYAPLLTDISDFLKFRFRTSGLANPGDVAHVVTESLMRELRARGSGHVTFAVNYVITALAGLSRDSVANAEETMRDFLEALRRLGELLRTASEDLSQPNDEEYDAPAAVGHGLMGSR